MAINNQLKDKQTNKWSHKRHRDNLNDLDALPEQDLSGDVLTTELAIHLTLIY